MKRPPRIYQTPELRCRQCGERIEGHWSYGWKHIQRIGIKDPRWHVARP